MDGGGEGVAEGLEVAGLEGEADGETGRLVPDEGVVEIEITGAVVLAGPADAMPGEDEAAGLGFGGAFDDGIGGADFEVFVLGLLGLDGLADELHGKDRVAGLDEKDRAVGDGEGGVDGDPEGFLRIEAGLGRGDLFMAHQEWIADLDGVGAGIDEEILHRETDPDEAAADDDAAQPGGDFFGEGGRGRRVIADLDGHDD